MDISPLWIVVGLVLFVFGVRWAIMRRAGSDYQRTKAGLPGMRSSYWHGFWAMLRAAVLALMIVAALVVFDLRGQSPDVGGWVSQLRGRVPSVSTGEPAAPPRDRRVEDNQRARDGTVICFSAECRRRHPE